jgi:carbon-monoxide dehydrogenase large subunit
MSRKGVGKSVPRKEDDRYLRGRGQFVAEKRRDAAFTAADLTGVKPIRAVSSLSGFKPSEQPCLARDKVCQVGEPIAACVAATRAEAEDIAAEIEVDFEELPAVVDMIAARAPDAPLVHEEWGDNVFLESLVDGDADSVKGKAAIRKWC